jgi:segregation and condensation protein B
METLPLKQIVEGAIMAADSPLTVDQLMGLFEKDAPERSEVREVLKEIEQDCEGRGFELKKVASGYRFQVRSDYGEWVSRLWKEKPPRYTRALLETLALVAYKQPITRGDIEEIRGVAVSTNIMRTLLEREWVRVVGHRDVPGHPALYATTKSFLDYFNLQSLDELPTLAEIRDLTKLNEELDLEEDLIEIRTLEVDSEEEQEVAGLDDADLDAVTAQVDNIQENIRTLFAEDEEPDDGLDDDDEDPEPAHTASVTPIAEARATQQTIEDSAAMENSTEAEPVSAAVSSEDTAADPEAPDAESPDVDSEGTAADPQKDA